MRLRRRLLLLRRGEIAGSTFRGAYLETDFASLLAWRDWGFPDKSIRNCFPMAALRAADGAFLVGVMGPHTANAGHVYFPAGTPDPDDIVGDTVDLSGGVMRELTEETGLTGADVAVESAGITLVKGDLNGIARARTLAQATIGNIRQNLFFAFLYNVLGVPVAAGVLYPLTGTLLSPMLAAAAMSLSSVSVISNALRLRTLKL